MQWYFAQLHAVIRCTATCSDALHSYMQWYLYTAACSDTLHRYMQWYFAQLHAVIPVHSYMQWYLYTATCSDAYTQLHGVMLIHSYMEWYLYTATCSGILHSYMQWYLYTAAWWYVYTVIPHWAISLQVITRACPAKPLQRLQIYRHATACARGVEWHLYVYVLAVLVVDRVNLPAGSRPWCFVCNHFPPLSVFNPFLAPRAGEPV